MNIIALELLLLLFIVDSFATINMVTLKQMHRNIVNILFHLELIRCY